MDAKVPMARPPAFRAGSPTSLASYLRALGWTVSADRVRSGSVLPARVLTQLRENVGDKRAFLASHTFRPGTCGEETHERVASWCDRADAVLASFGGLR